MKLLIGQLAIILLAIATSLLTLYNFRNGALGYAIPLALWTSILIGLGFWTRINPQKAFIGVLVLYILTVVIKDAFYGGEYALTFLFHIYFGLSMLIGMTASKKIILN